MNTIQDSPFSIARIICEKQTLRVPIYQRLFVWEYSQISQLLRDLYQASAMAKPYYIGVITVKINDDNEWEIVDGQQRITFLTLISCELGWNDFIFTNDNMKLRIAYTGREQDEEDLKKYHSALLLNDLTQKEQKLVQLFNLNFKTFHKAFEDLKNQNSDTKDRLTGYVRENCQFLVNKLPDTYGPFELNLYFEKMNSTGRQLTPIECIKGKYFPQYANEWNDCMNFDDAYKNIGDSLKEAQILKTQTLEDFFYDKNHYVPSEKQDNKIYIDRLILLPEILLLHVLKIVKNNILISLDKSKLIETFKINEDFDRYQFINELKAYRQWLDDNIIYLKNDNGTYHYHFRKQDDESGGSQIEHSEQTETGTMKQFQSMLYVSSPDSQEWVLDAYMKFKKNNQPLSLETLYEIDHIKHPILLSQDQMKYSCIDRYWFWKLDYLLWEQITQTTSNKFDYNLTDKEWAAVKSYVFRTNRSIEHLHPQSKEDSEWGMRDNPDSPMHQFGNLAMISIGGNSTQSDDGIGTKFGRVKDWINDGRLESIKMLLMFKLSDGEETKWTPKVAKEHGERMMELLKDDRVNW